jgi:hypothetical protein
VLNWFSGHGVQHSPAAGRADCVFKWVNGPTAPPRAIETIHHIDRIDAAATALKGPGTSMLFHSLLCVHGHGVQPTQSLSAPIPFWNHVQQPLEVHGKAEVLHWHCSSRNGTLQSSQHNSYNTTTKMAQSCYKDSVSEFHEKEPFMLNAPVANRVNDVKEVTEGTECDSSETHG